MAKITQTVFKPKWYHTFLVKYWWILIVILVLVVFSFEYFFVVKPRKDRAANGGPFDLATYQQILDEQKDYFEKLKVWEKEASSINKAELEKLNYVVAEKMDLPAALKQVDILDVQSGLELVGFSVDYSQGVVTTNLTFKGGSYQTIKQYLDFIEKNIRIMDVEKIDIGEMGNIFSLSIKSYYLD